MIEFGARNGPRHGSLSLRSAAEHLSCGTNLVDALCKITRHTMPSNFRANSLKTNDGCPYEVTHKMTVGNARISHRSFGAPAIFILLRFVICFPVVAQTQNAPTRVPGDLASDLKEFVETPSVSGYEQQLTEKIRATLAAFHPVVDNLGDVIVTIGSGAPHRLIVTPIDEPGFIVSGITDDGYLRLQRLPQSGLPPIFNELYSAQPVKIRTASGKWIDGVVAGISVHLHRADEATPSASDIENMYVDIGATSAAEARAAGVDIL